MYTILPKVMGHDFKSPNSCVPITSMATGVKNQTPRHAECF